jgi:hypothetical protein
MCKKGKLPFISLVLFLFSIQTAWSTEIKTTLDRNPVNINESFQIIFTATETPDDDPDFSSLERNFEILNQSHRSNSSWINGKYTKSIQWILNVMARQAGKLMIPVVSFGDDVSQPVEIVVTKGSVEVEATPERAYVQSQIRYTLRLYTHEKIQFASQPRLSDLQIADALIEKLGDVKTYTTNLKGVEYNVNDGINGRSRFQ